MSSVCWIWDAPWHYIRWYYSNVPLETALFLKELKVSATKLKSKGYKGSPCLNPLYVLKHPFLQPLMFIHTLFPLHRLHYPFPTSLGILFKSLLLLRNSILLGHMLSQSLFSWLNLSSYVFCVHVPPHKVLLLPQGYSFPLLTLFDSSNYLLAYWS